MLHDLKLTKKQKTLLVVIPSCLLLGVLAWWFTGNEGVTHEQQVSKVDNTIKIMPNTNIVQTLFYTKCKDQEVSTIEAKENEIGMNYQEFQMSYPKWNIETFDLEQIVMSSQIDDYCKEHLSHQFIGIQGSYVAIFYGKPGEKSELKEITQIATKNLQPQAAEEIRQGIVFQSKEEMLKILEGLHSK